MRRASLARRASEGAGFTWHDARRLHSVLVPVSTSNSGHEGILIILKLVFIVVIAAAAHAPRAAHRVHGDLWQEFVALRQGQGVGPIEAGKCG